LVDAGFFEKINDEYCRLSVVYEDGSVYEEDIYIGQNENATITAASDEKAALPLKYIVTGAIAALLAVNAVVVAFFLRVV
jgi:hypothetical protein